MNLDEFLKSNKEILDLETQIRDLNNKLYTLKINKSKDIDVNSNIIANLFNKINFKEAIISVDVLLDASLNEDSINKGFTCCFNLDIRNIPEDEIFAIENFCDVLINGEEFYYCYYDSKMTISFETKEELRDILNYFNVDGSKISFSISDTAKSIINISNDLSNFSLEFL